MKRYFQRSKSLFVLHKNFFVRRLGFTSLACPGCCMQSISGSQDKNVSVFVCKDRNYFCLCFQRQKSFLSLLAKTKKYVLAFWYSADSITHTSSELPFSLRPKGTSSVTQTAVVLKSADIFICKYFFMQLTISQKNSCEAQVTCHVKKIDIQRNQGEKENLWPYDKKLDKEYGQETFMTALLNAVGQLLFLLHHGAAHSASAVQLSFRFQNN